MPCWMLKMRTLAVILLVSGCFLQKLWRSHRRCGLVLMLPTAYMHFRDDWQKHTTGRYELWNSVFCWLLFMFFPLIWQFCLQTYISNLIYWFYILCVASIECWLDLQKPMPFYLMLFWFFCLIRLPFDFVMQILFFLCFRNLLMMQFLRLGLYGCDALPVAVL